jgi:hypothetical protein
MIDLLCQPTQGSLLGSRRIISRVHVPSNQALTPRVLTGAVMKFPTVVIRNLVDLLIDELDTRCGDPDREPETDEASESDEVDTRP